MAETLDLPPLAVAVGRRMRTAGLPATPDRAARFARALAVARPATRDELYWAARVNFVSSREQVGVFDADFSAVFDGMLDPADERGDPNAPGLEAGPRPPVPGGGAAPAPGGAAGRTQAGGDSDRETREAPIASAASSAERLAQTSFAELAPEELLALAGLMRELELHPPLRRSRRVRRSRRGEQLDLRATLRAARRTGGDPIRHMRRRRRLRPRRLVVLCDVSGSMEPFTRAFLQFSHSAVGATGAEAFVFSTRLTRVTRELRAGRPQMAIERAVAAAPDMAGGTRIGAALQAFNNRHGRRGMARGAVVVIVSDGWERDDPELLGREMERLRRLAHRIVWVNPRRAAPGFEPRTGGMAAAVPFCDELLSGHTLAALREVAAAIASDHRRNPHGVR